MSIKTDIHWCDSTVNPVMGCDGCELWPTVHQLAREIEIATAEFATTRSEIEAAITGISASDIYQTRHLIANALASQNEEPIRQRMIKAIKMAIPQSFRCYAGNLHLRHGGDPTQPLKKTNSGYAAKFEDPELFLGRIKLAAGWADLTGKQRKDKPWLNGLPRMIFISDMGDAFSKCISYDYLLEEVIQHVTSPTGSRHVWLWLTKRPARMAEFSEWIERQGIAWPSNLVAMTSVTSNATVGRVEQLKRVRCASKGLSIEPLWSSVELPLHGISWVVVGGESGPYAKPFELEWARSILKQCRQRAVAAFIKQLGARPVSGHLRLDLLDPFGGDWNEWPEDLKVRQIPWGNLVVKLPPGVEPALKHSPHVTTPVGEVGIIVTSNRKGEPTDE